MTQTRSPLPGRALRHARALVAALSCGALLAACGGEATPPPTLGGGCGPVSSPYLAESSELGAGRITYCRDGDAWTGVVESAPFPAGTTHVDLLVAGYPDGRGVRLVARAVDGSQQAPLLRERIGEHWKPVRVAIPAPLRDRAFTVRLVDRSTATFGWGGVGFAADSASAPRFAAFASLLASVMLAHVWLTFAGLALPAAWHREVAPALLVLGVAALATIVATMLAPVAGRVVAWAALLGPPAFVLLRARTRPAWEDARVLSSRLAPAAALALLILWIGLYPFAWNGDDWQTPAMRWRGMPIDNWLPLLFAKMLAGGEIVRPMLGDWLGSDRPPLQAGVFLLFRDALPGPEGMGYQALSSWAQALALVAVASFVGGVASARDRALMLVVIGLSALLLLNGLFVWPKLLAAAYCATYHALLFRRREDASAGIAAAAGLSAALALLSHGGAFFALAGSTLALLAIRRMAALRPLLVAAATCVVAYLPWLAYQRLLDPPGDRLLKWHFAGMEAPTTRSFADVLASAYAGMSPEQWLATRWRNVEAIGDGTLRFFADAARLLAAPGEHALVRPMIESSFFSTTYSLWWFTPLWLPLLWLIARARRAPVTTPDGLAAATLAGLALWVLLMFSPGSTVVHQGAHFLVLALHLLVMLAAWRCSAALFRGLAIGNIVFAGLLYAFDRPWSMPWPAMYAAGTGVLAAMLYLACLHGERGRSRVETT